MIINDIVIIGGGSAGWMTAAILIKTFPEKNIFLVESENIPKVGVGESTYDGINFYLEYLGVDRKDFFSYTDATVKLAIQFKNFYKDFGEPDFIYPFGNPDLSYTAFGLKDWQIKKTIYPEIPVTDYAESYFPAAHLVKYNRLSDNEYGKLGNFDPILNTAMHFDAIKFSSWLKNNYAIPRGVKNIVADVVNIKVLNDGVEKIILDNGQEICADLYIDCTGFKSLLLDKSLKEPFISYNDVLPNTNAWAAQIEYKNPVKEINSVTRCTALKNGWCWNIPLWSRLGSGYVYSDKYISHDDALEEYKKYILNDLEIKRSKNDLEKINFRNIKMRVGIHERIWVKNVVAIGLSAGFIEPLESNGLFSVHEFLFDLIKTIKKEKINQLDIDMFNYATKIKFNEFVEFIKIHYAFSIRDDSEYWMDNFNKKYDIDKSRLQNYNTSYMFNIYDIKYKTSNIPTQGGINWILSGMNYQLIDEVSVRLSEIANKTNYKESLSNNFKLIDIKKNNWSLASLESESSYDYLKRKYFK